MTNWKSWDSTLVQELNAIVRINVSKLQKTICTLKASKRQHWVDTLKEDINELFVLVIEDAQSFVSIECLRKNCLKLCDILKTEMPPYEDSSLTLYEQRKMLEQRVKEYEGELVTRQTKSQELKEKDVELSKLLGTTPMTFAEKGILSSSQLETLSLHIDKLEKEKSEIEEEYQNTKTKISIILPELGLQLPPSLQKYISLIDSKEILMNKVNLNVLTNYYDTLIQQQKEEERKQLESLKVVINELYEKCRVAETDRKIPLANELDIIQAEIISLKDYLESNGPTFTLLDKYNKYWEVVAHYVENLTNVTSQNYLVIGKICRQIYKLENDLIAFGLKFENDNKKPFTSFGSTIPNIIAKLHDSLGKKSYNDHGFIKDLSRQINENRKEVQNSTEDGQNRKKLSINCQQEVEVPDPIIIKQEVEDDNRLETLPEFAPGDYNEHNYSVLTTSQQRNKPSSSKRCSKKSQNPTFNRKIKKKLKKSNKKEAKMPILYPNDAPGSKEKLIHLPVKAINTAKHKNKPNTLPSNLNTASQKRILVPTLPHASKTIKKLKNSNSSQQSDVILNMNNTNQLIGSRQKNILDHLPHTSKAIQIYQNKSSLATNTNTQKGNINVNTIPVEQCTSQQEDIHTEYILPHPPTAFVKYQNESNVLLNTNNSDEGRINLNINNVETVEQSIPKQTIPKQQTNIVLYLPHSSNPIENLKNDNILSSNSNNSLERNINLTMSNAESPVSVNFFVSASPSNTASKNKKPKIYSLCKTGKKHPYKIKQDKKPGITEVGFKPKTVEVIQSLFQGLDLK